MKLNRKQVIWVLASIVVLVALIFVMAVHTGLLESTPENNNAKQLLQEMEVVEPTHTPKPESGWWDKQPTPISLD